jgi:hypothetical protein
MKQKPNNPQGEMRSLGNVRDHGLEGSAPPISEEKVWNKSQTLESAARSICCCEP